MGSTLGIYRVRQPGASIQACGHRVHRSSPRNPDQTRPNWISTLINPKAQFFPPFCVKNSIGRKLIGLEPSRVSRASPGRENAALKECGPRWLAHPCTKSVPNQPDYDPGPRATINEQVRRGSCGNLTDATIPRLRFCYYGWRKKGATRSHPRVSGAGACRPTLWVIQIKISFQRVSLSIQDNRPSASVWVYTLSHCNTYNTYWMFCSESLGKCLEIDFENQGFFREF